ncbi:30S ribosomal protein S21 [Candidatus Kaiserbacteria bacterium]|nr:30S ribosomal protein S21 [Candidatus Kaiserbacteria bacterium]
MSVNAEVQKSGNETAISIIRKFSRRVQGAGVMKTMRDRRYFARDTSKIVKKKRALKLLKRRAEYKQLVKEGKIAEAPVRGRHGPTRDSSQRLGEGTPIAR